MRRETRTQDIIQISREDWNILNWRVKKILTGNVKIIDKDKNGGDKQDDGRE